MRTYTEEEVLKIVEYACGMQKAECYQEVAHLLTNDVTDYHTRCVAVPFMMFKIPSIKA